MYTCPHCQAPVTRSDSRCESCNREFGNLAPRVSVVPGKWVLIAFVTAVVGCLITMHTLRREVPSMNVTQFRLAELAIALDTYRDDWGAYPSSPTPRRLEPTWCYSLAPPHGPAYLDNEEARNVDMDQAEAYRNKKGGYLTYQCPGLAHPKAFDLWFADDE